MPHVPELASIKESDVSMLLPVLQLTKTFPFHLIFNALLGSTEMFHKFVKMYEYQQNLIVRLAGGVEFRQRHEF